MDNNKSQKFTLFLNAVHAGFPSPANDLIDKSIDLNEHLISHPTSTYLMRVKGDSMKDAGIFDEDILIVDKSLEPKNGSVVIASIDGEFTVKRFKKESNSVYLLPANPHYPTIRVNEDSDFEIWGIVTFAIHDTTSTFNY